MRIDTQFSVFLINTPGVMGAVTTALADAGVNLFALSLSDSGEHGVLRLVGTQPETIRKVLRETHDRWTETDVIVYEIGNQPGAFASLAKTLAEGEININYAYFTGDEAPGGSTVAIIKVDNPQQALETIGKNC